MGHKEKKGLMGGKKPYLLVMGAGLVVGAFLYHMFGTSIDSVWNKTPYLSQYKSHFAVSNIGSEL